MTADLKNVTSHARLHKLCYGSCPCLWQFHLKLTCLSDLIMSSSPCTASGVERSTVLKLSATFLNPSLND